MFRASRSQGEATERPVCVGYFGPIGRTACRVRSADRRPPVHRAGGGLGLESSRVVAAIACFVLWDGDMVHVGRGVAKAFG